MFLSRRPNLDPKPWRTDEATRTIYSPGRHERSAFNGYRHRVLAPRPEFDVGDNPILLALVTGKPTSDSYEMLQILSSRWAAKFTPAERDHARAVLTRLANLTGSDK